MRRRGTGEGGTSKLLRYINGEVVLRRDVASLGGRQIPRKRRVVITPLEGIDRILKVYQP